MAKKITKKPIDNEEDLPLENEFIIDDDVDDDYEVADIDDKAISLEEIDVDFDEDDDDDY
ncbi:MAG: hypothetical protein EAZ51_08215 [Sphingobacteriales bacterium]|nr:MAG: hypothetical protein EAZ64_00685 [Sphingobacteriales bacterium]TAF79140.1 MAG: hypothetical protein EAZ51_08215 [Sphingobacteriales bacterium]